MDVFPDERGMSKGQVSRPMPGTNDEWTAARRHMGLESLARVTDTLTVRLPAVATRPDPDLSEGRRSCGTPRVMITQTREWPSFAPPRRRILLLR
ncbi:MAG: hypothetical protein ACXIUV_03900 [Alkalilacustris sp.]